MHWHKRSFEGTLLFAGEVPLFSDSTSPLQKRYSTRSALAPVSGAHWVARLRTWALHGRCTFCRSSTCAISRLDILCCLLAPSTQVKSWPVDAAATEGLGVGLGWKGTPHQNLACSAQEAARRHPWAGTRVVLQSS